MSDFSIRSDNVDVEQIMRQIRARIRDKRGVDYTEEEIRELANVKLEKFLDPRGVRSDLLEQFRRKREASLPPNYKFEDTTLYETHRGFLAFMRKLLNPILKLFFNPNPLIEALHIQSKLNAQQAALEPLYYEVIHNLVLETTRLGIDVKNLKMRVESMSSRLDFDERRARALEGVVQYRPGTAAPLQPPTGSADSPESRGPESPEQSERRNRRRRRRGRRRPDERTGAMGAMGATGATGAMGASGATGAMGASGDMGAMGASGASSAIGGTAAAGEGLPRASETAREGRSVERAPGAEGTQTGEKGSTATEGRASSVDRSDSAAGPEPVRTDSDGYESAHDGDRSES